MWTKLKYGFTIITAIAAGGVAIYYTPKPYIRSYDMTEMVMGCQERVFATQFVAEQPNGTFTQTVAHSRNTWTNTPFVWYETLTNGIATNYLKSSSGLTIVTNDYVTDWWADTNQYLDYFTVTPIIYSALMASNTGERMLSAGYTNMSISGVPVALGARDDDINGNYYLAGRYRNGKLVRACKANASTTISIDQGLGLYNRDKGLDFYDLWENSAGQGFINLSQRSAGFIYDISNFRNYSGSDVENSSAMFGDIFGNVFVTGWIEWGTVHGSCGYDNIHYGPIYNMANKAYYIPVITNGNINTNFIRDALIYVVYMNPSNPITTYTKKVAYQQAAERTWYLINGTWSVVASTPDSSTYLVSSTNEGGEYVGYYVTNNLSFPRIVRTNLLTSLGITNYTSDITSTTFNAWLCSPYISSNKLKEKYDILKNLKYTEQIVSNEVWVTTLWRGISTSSWADAVAIAETNYHISTNANTISSELSGDQALFKCANDVNINEKYRKGGKWTMGELETYNIGGPYIWYATAFSEEIVRGTVCNTNVDKVVSWYDAHQVVTNLANISAILSIVFPNYLSSVVFDGFGATNTYDNLKWGRVAVGSSNVVTNVIGNINIPTWCNEPASLYQTNSISWRGYLRRDARAIPAWQFQYCTNN